MEEEQPILLGHESEGSSCCKGQDYHHGEANYVESNKDPHIFGRLKALRHLRRADIVD